MKKLLLLSLLTITFLQAEEDTTMQSADVCKVYFGSLYKNGYKYKDDRLTQDIVCKENDILLSTRAGKNEHLLAICKVGTLQIVGESQVSCILRAEKDIGKIINEKGWR